jgi:hypothetical protein
MCDGQPIEMENARLFFKDIEDRNNTMLTIMHQYTNYIIALLVGIWTIVGAIYAQNPCKNLSWFLIIATNLSALLLILWRYYVHYIDNDIAKNYKRLVYYENILMGNPSMPHKQSIFQNVLNDLPYWKAYTQGKFDKNNQEKEKSLDKKYQTFCNLVDAKRIGHRGQLYFDIAAYCLIVFLLIFEISFSNQYLQINCLILAMGLIVVDLIIFCVLLGELCQCKEKSNVENNENKLPNDKDNSITKFCEKFLKYLLPIIAIIPIGFLIITLLVVSSDWFTVFILLSKDALFVLLMAYLYYCYMQRDPIDTDIKNAIPAGPRPA